MIIVKLMGGLGNQMFQYALARKLELKGEKALLDVTAYKNSRVHNNYELENIFDLHPLYANESDIKKVRLNIKELSINERIIRKIKLKVGLPYSHYTEKRFYSFDPNVLKLTGNYYLEGFWQSYKYFIDIDEVIRNKFQFKKPLDENNKKILKFIQTTNSISIHIRRGDMLTNSLHSNICNLEYYEKSINTISEKIDKPVFFIFSDDVRWCKKHLKLDNIFYIEGNNGKDGYKDMQLMSMCKHNIIANSSFSWWAAWLNQNIDKIVIAPSRMINMKLDFKDAFPSTWLILQV